MLDEADQMLERGFAESVEEILAASFENCVCCICTNTNYRIAGNFRGSKYSWFGQFLVNVFMVSLQVKVVKVASFVVKIFVLQCCLTTKTHEYFAPQKLPAIRCRL